MDPNDLGNLPIAQDSSPVHEQCDSSCPERVDASNHRPSPSGAPSNETDKGAQLAPGDVHVASQPPTQTVPLAIDPDVPPAFKHAPLPLPSSMIRLLKIKRASLRADPIDAELLDFDIGNVPEYGALSYCWGRSTDGFKILCNGKVLPVRQNLQGALKRLRAGFEPGQIEDYIWADAICIDQQNLTEKSEQIVLMERIYSNAKTVYVDLGAVERETLSMGNFTMSWSGMGGTGSQYVLTRSDSPDHPLHYQTAFFALTKPWFSRAWPIQEITLARQAKFLFQGNVFSQTELDAILSKDAMDSLPDRAKELMANPDASRGYTNYTKVAVIRNSWRTGQKDSLHFAQLTRDFVATEPKDKIFGLMALMTDSDRAAIGSYSQPVQTVYRRFAALHVRQGRALTILDSAGIQTRGRMREHIPSWVPDWTARSSGPKPISIIRPVPYAASGSLVARIELIGDDTGTGGLRVRGRLIDTIDAVHGFAQGWTLGGNASFSAGLVRVRTALDDWLRSSKADPEKRKSTFSRVKAAFDKWSNINSYADPDDAFARLLLMDGTYKGYNAVRHRSPIVEPAKTYQDAIKAWEQGKNGQADGSKMDAVQTFQMQASTACAQRNFAIMRGGYIALVPLVAQAGDVVAVFFGANVPYVLRPVQGGHILVGAVYVQGIMNGEAARGSNLEAVDFQLL